MARLPVAAHQAESSCLQEGATSQMVGPQLGASACWGWNLSGDAASRLPRATGQGVGDRGLDEQGRPGMALIHLLCSHAGNRRPAAEPRPRVGRDHGQEEALWLVRPHDSEIRPHGQWIYRVSSPPSHLLPRGHPSAVHPGDRSGLPGHPQSKWSWGSGLRASLPRGVLLPHLDLSTRQGLSKALRASPAAWPLSAPEWHHEGQRASWHLARG